MKTKYMILVEKLDKLIDRLGYNKPIPSERELSQKYGMSRVTVRRAIDVLVRQHKLYRVQNIGTYTTDKKLYKPMDVFTGFTKEVEAAKGKVQNVLIEYSLLHADKSIAAKLAIEPDSLIYKVVRLRKKNNVPLILDESYFPRDIIPLSETIVGGSIYAYIQDQLGLKMVSAEQKLVATFAKQAYLNYLEIDETTPVLFVALTGFLETGRIFEYTESYKRSDQYELVVKSFTT